MALTDENGMVLPVTPMGNGNNGCGFGGDWAWIILLLLLGWGNNGFGGYGGGNQLGYDFPWLLNGQNGINSNVNDGFQNLATQNQLTAVQSDLGDIQTQLCNGFAGVNATVNGGFANTETAANSRQMASMNQLFGLSQQFADCCCENRLANCQTQNIIQNEGNQTRFADAQNTRDIIETANRNNQAVLDKLCQLELSAKDDKISDLERQLTMASLSASQTAQTAQILADNSRQTSALEQYLNPVPIPAYVVQNPNCCLPYNTGCGCA